MMLPIVVSITPVEEIQMIVLRNHHVLKTLLYYVGMDDVLQREGSVYLLINAMKLILLDVLMDYVPNQVQIAKKKQIVHLNSPDVKMEVAEKN
jgi:hypothetical protein